MRMTFLLAAVASIPLVACGSDGSGSSGGLKVAAAFYPIEEIVHRVGGDQADVVALVPPGEEAHEYDPTPQQLTELADADVVFYLGQGFQPNVEKAIESLPADVDTIDLLADLDLLPAGDGSDRDDPHVWLSPHNMVRMSTTVLATLQEMSPDDARTFANNSGVYTNELTALDEEYDGGLRSCDSRLLVTAHRAFAYLADAYDLEAVSVTGISPAEEPSAKTIEEVAAFAEENDVTTIFFEENLPADLAATVADEIGADTAVLDPVESLSAEQLDAGDDYLSLMRDNLAAIAAGLRCT